jgi:integrase
MLIEITDKVVIAYQNARLSKKAAGKTINEEVGTLFRIMGDVGETIWLNLKKDKKLKLTERNDVGRALTVEEEKSLLAQTRASLSPHIHAAVTIALQTGLRYSEIRRLQWRQIDFLKKMLTVGKSKTRAGTRRTIPLSELLNTLAERQAWYREHIGKPEGDHYVFPNFRDKRFDQSRFPTSIRPGMPSVRGPTSRSGFTI